MLDAVLRPVIDRPLNAAGSKLARRGFSANAVTAAGLAAGLLCAGAVAMHWYGTSLVLLVLNRVLDGLDGAVARATEPTDSGGYLDIVVDYVFYAGVPLAFAVANPARNALPAAVLLAGFCLTATGFLAFAIVAAKRGLESDAQGRKSFFYSTGVVEGSETVIFFVLMMLMPAWFPYIAGLFAVLCVVTAVQRTLLAMMVFGSSPHAK